MGPGGKHLAPTGGLDLEANVLTEPQTVTPWAPGEDTCCRPGAGTARTHPRAPDPAQRSAHCAASTAASKGSGKVGRSRDQHNQAPAVGHGQGTPAELHHGCPTGSRTPLGYQRPRMLQVPYIQCADLHITYPHPPMYFKSPVDYLQYPIQCECYVNSCYTVLCGE